jgi:hypothetical protein
MMPELIWYNYKCSIKGEIEMTEEKRNQRLVEGKLLIGNAKLLFRNFSGKKGNVNPEGVRNFCIYLDEDIAEILSADGWNIKRTKPFGDEKLTRPYTQIRVSYEGKTPPLVVMITSGGKTRLDERDIKVLDYAEIETCDIVINPYHWTNAKKETGIKGYLGKIWVTIHEDEFEKKYADAPDTAKNSLGEDEG